MTAPFMDAYVKLLIKTCHRRGVHAMGGVSQTSTMPRNTVNTDNVQMAAQIPIKNDKEANDKAMAGVRADKLREVRAVARGQDPGEDRFGSA